MTDLSITELARVVLRFFRRQPLLQLSIAATLWVPLTLSMRVIAAELGIEGSIDTDVASWAIQVMGAGLGYLLASAFVTASNTWKAMSRRRLRADRREKARTRRKEKIEARFRKIREATESLDDADRELLRLFVDHKRSSLPYRAVFPKHQDAYNTLHGLEWVWRHGSFDSDVYLQDYLYPLLLEHPDLVGSGKKPTLLSPRMKELVDQFRWG